MGRLLRRILLVMLAGLTTASCYHHVDPGPTAVPRGARLKITLEAPASFALPALTAHNVTGLDAELVRATADSMVVSVLWLDALNTDGFSGGSWTLHVPTSNVGRIQLRRFSVWRTAAVVVGGFVATWAGFDALGWGEGGSGLDDGGGVAR